MGKKRSFKFYSTWVIVLVFILNYILVAQGIDGMNVLMPALHDKFHWNDFEIMSRVSLGSFFSLVTGFILSSIIMKFGNKIVLTCALVGTAALTIGMANVRTLDQFVAISLATAFVGPAVAISSFSLVCNWFVRKRGLIFGIVTIGAPLSSATFTPIGTKIMAATGFTTFYMGWGIIILILGVFAFFTAFEKPEDYGYYPDGDEYTKEQIEEMQKMKEAKSDWGIKRILLTKETWFIIFGWGFIFLMMTGIMSQFIPTLMRAGIPQGNALLMMTIAAVIGVPLSYLWGWLDDKLGTPITCTIFSFTYLIASVSFLLGTGDNLIPFYIAMLMVAATTGGMPNLVPSIQGYVYGRKEFVNANRYINVGHGIFRSIGFSYMAFFYTRYGSYRPVFISFIFMSLIVAGLFLLTRKTYDPERIELQKIGKAC